MNLETSAAAQGGFCRPPCSQECLRDNSMRQGARPPLHSQTKGGKQQISVSVDTGIRARARGSRACLVHRLLFPLCTPPHSHRSGIFTARSGDAPDILLPTVLPTPHPCLAGFSAEMLPSPGSHPRLSGLMRPPTLLSPSTLSILLRDADATLRLLLSDCLFQTMGSFRMSWLQLPLYPQYPAQCQLPQ